MEIHLSPEQASKLEQLASEFGRDVHSLAQEAICRYLEEEARFVGAVKLGECQLRDEFLTHAQAGISKKTDFDERAAILDREDAGTLSAIDRSINSADEGRVMRLEDVRQRLHASKRGPRI